MTYILTSNSYAVTADWVKHLETRGQSYSAAFIDTAADMYDKPNASWLQADRQALEDVGIEVTDYNLVGKTIDDLRSDLAKFDILFVAGGNTFYLLEKALSSGFVELLQNGEFDAKTYVGSSAGSVLLSNDIDPIKFLDDPAAAQLMSTTAVGVIDFVILPHWGSEKFWPKYKQAIEYIYQQKLAALTLADHQYILIKDGLLTVNTVDVV